MKKEIDIGKCFKDSIDTYKNNFGVMILSSLLASLIGILTCGVLYAPMIVGVFLIVDRLFKNDAEKPVAGDVFKGMSKFTPAFICFILFAILYAIACAVPVVGVIAAWITSPLLMFALIYITFEEMDAIAAMKRVFQELFSGDILMPVVVGILAGLAGGIGALACGVGVIFTMPIVPLAYISVYYQMKAGGDQIPDAEIISTDDDINAETSSDTPSAPPPESPESYSESTDDQERPGKE